MERPWMPEALAHEVCDALGVALPGDRGSLDAFVSAWSAAVPFDPVAKVEAVRAGRRPPGDDPVEVLQRWLRTGIGSTCWGHSTALAAMLDRAGVATSIGVDRMRTDEVVDFHSFLLADVDGDRFLIDPIHPSGSLLPFAAGAVGDHPHYEVGLEREGDRLLHWFGPPEDRTRYVVLATDLDVADVRSFLDVSVRHSGVRSGRFFLRRVLPDAVLRFGPTDDGTGLTRTRGRGRPELLPAGDFDATLAAIGYQPAAMEVLVDAGLFDPSSPTPWLSRAPSSSPPDARDGSEPSPLGEGRSFER